MATHRQGIIGANPGNPFNISGVAPDASITSYRVFGCTGFVTDDGLSFHILSRRVASSFEFPVLVEALLRGVSEGQDILTLSLSGADGWTEGTVSVLASRIASNGKIVTIAAGNDVSSLLNYL